MTLKEQKDFYKQFRPGIKVMVKLGDEKIAKITKYPHHWGPGVYIEVKTPNGRIKQVNVNKLTVIR